VLRDGETVGSGPAHEIGRPQLIQLMVGRDLVDALPSAAAETGSGAALRVRGLSIDGALDGVDLDVAPGEIVGLAGLLGAGRSELLEALFGLRRPSAGTIEIHGAQARLRSPRDAIGCGLALVPADRKLQGLVQRMTVRENLVMAATSSTLRVLPPRTATEQPLVNAAVESMRIRAQSPRAAVGTLSGGNQQKVVLGKWLATEPRVLMLDEPTRGVDVGAKAEIYALVDRLTRDGLGVLFISSELPELLGMADRIVVMKDGRTVGELARGKATEERLMELATSERAA
jgi:ABC-type sugar transport system ATPase subunit